MSTIKGLDAHLTSGPPESPDPKHWHVRRHGEDDDPFITTDFWAALDYVGTELRELSEFEYTGIAPSGEAGDYEGAYRAWVRSNDMDALYQDVKHVIDQHDKTDPDEDERYNPAKHRAPLYCGYGGDERIMETALRVVERVNSESPVSIWDCVEELIYVDENYRGSIDSNGKPYDEDTGFPAHANEYYPG